MDDYSLIIIIKCAKETHNKYYNSNKIIILCIAVQLKNENERVKWTVNKQFNNGN